MTANDLLVVIVSADDGRWLRACFDALAESSDKDFDTLLIVNECVDESAHEAARASLRVDVVHTAPRCGFAEANNIGIRRAFESGYRYVFLLNPDTRVHAHAIRHLRGFLRTHPRYGIVGSQQIEYGAADWESPNGWTIETIRHARQLGQRPMLQGNWTTVDHYYVQGAAFMMAVELVPLIGMLDPLYGSFYEETDLCRRCLLAGYDVAIVLDSKVKHYGGGHWRQSASRHLSRDVLFLRNQFLYFMSDTDNAVAALARGGELLVRQLRGLRRGENLVRLPWWRYPAVLMKVAAVLPHVRRLQRRNRTIRSRARLAPSDYTIGATRC